MEYELNLYPNLESKLSTGINRGSAKAVIDIWQNFKSVFEASDLVSNPNVRDFGIQAELYLGSQNSPPCFYFAMQYQLTYMEDDEEYAHYEHVYCEFDLSGHDLSKLNDNCLELWCYEYNLEQMFGKIENWETFQKFKNKTLSHKVYGTEV